jgi:curved DNA-binding protein CbpA|nr:MAG TPA: DnaJ-like protein [Caudoviricetes sp.]
MKYFNNIKSFSDLKKQYRKLVLDNHPDKGGTIEVMQEINKEFEQLFNVWKYKKETEDNTGYANDYEGATAKEYTQQVYEEYSWTGSRYDGRLTLSDICKKVAAWVKKTYPNLTFSIYQEHSLSIHIKLIVSDFNPFTDGNFSYEMDLNPYHFEGDNRINDRAKDILSNVKNYAMSYNYDKSNSQIDYFNTNFYFYIGIGSSKRPFKIEIPKSRRASGACAPEFEYKEGPVHQAIKKALKKQYFADLKGEMILCEKHYYKNEEYDSECYLFTNSNHFAIKRIESLKKAGIVCELTRRGTIKFIGYTPEVEKALAEEDRAKEEAYKRWKEEQAKGTAGKSHKENTSYGDGEKSLFFFNAFVAFLDAVQEVMKEQQEEKQPEPEDIAKVLEVFPALLDAVCEIMKAEPAKEPRNKEREQGTNEIYNSVCSSAILSGDYIKARQEIKQAISRYRFTLPQLKYLIYILNTHPGIKRESHRKAA